MKPYESWLVALAVVFSLCGIGLAVLGDARPARAFLGFALIYVMLAVTLVAIARIRK
jgi:hypothetical protein